MKLFCLVVITACSSAPRISSDGVRIYHTLPERYEEIAWIDSASTPKMLEAAAALGANGIVVDSAGVVAVKTNGTTLVGSAVVGNYPVRKILAIRVLPDAR